MSVITSYRTFLCRLIAAGVGALLCALVIAWPVAAQTVPLPVYVPLVTNGGVVPADAAPAAADPAAIARWVYLPSVRNGAPPAARWVSPQTGGVVDLGNVTISVPAGALSRPTAFSAVTGALPAPPPGLSSGGAILALSAVDDAGNPVTTFAKAVEVRVHYNPATLTAIDPARLVLYFQNAGSWAPLVGRVDLGAQIVIAQTTHFSNFALFATPLSGALGSPTGGTSANKATIAAVAQDGALLFTHTGTAWETMNLHVWRLPAGATATAARYFWLGSLGVPNDPHNWPIYHNVEPSAQANTVYVRRVSIIFALDLAQSEPEHPVVQRIYPPVGDTACPMMTRMRFDRFSNTLWVACHAGGVTALRQVNPATGAVLRSLPLPFGDDETEDIAVDSQGHIFATGYLQNGSPLSTSGWTAALMMWNEGAAQWRRVAEGFHTRYGGGYGQPLAVDDNGHLFMANEEPGVITVFGGATPQVVGSLALGAPAVSLAYGAGRLIVSTGTSFISLGGNFWQPVAPAATLRVDPAASFSGKEGTVKLSGTLPLLPAHARVFLGNEQVPLYDVTASAWRFGPLPLGQTGALRVQVGDGVVQAGSPALPGVGNWRRYDYQRGYYWQCTTTPQIMNVGEWMVWKQYDEVYNGTQSLSSPQGIFPPWTASERTWFAYQFATAGNYTFVVDGETCPVTARYEGRDSDYDPFTVAPAIGGTFYSNNLRMEIPPGALPGTAPYALYLKSVPDAGGGHHGEYEFVPEPAQLLKDLRFATRFDPANPATRPSPAFHDDGLAVDTPADYQQAMDFPIRNEVDSTLGWSIAVLKAGVYSGTGGVVPPAVAAETGTAAASPFAGFDLRAKLNDIGRNLKWQVGLPNKKLEDANITVLYHDKGVTEEKALAAYGALVAARVKMGNLGFTLPGWVIVDLDPALAAEGRSSGVGRMLNWQLALGSWQAIDDLRSAAVHEYFHIVQYQNMSYVARTTKSTFMWLMEGTAVWAETMVLPDANSAADNVKKGADFVNTGMNNWRYLTDDQAYATVAFFRSLEEQKPGTILKLLQGLGAVGWPTYATPVGGLDSITGGLGLVYDKFVRAYFGQQEEPYKSWDIHKAWSPTLLFDKPELLLFGSTFPAYSTRAITITAAAGPAPGVAFSEIDGSVVRNAGGAGGAQTFVWNPGTTAPLPALVGSNDPGRKAAQASTFTAAKPLRVVHTNGTAADDPTKVWLEAPTVTAAAPSSFRIVQEVNVQAGGSGFGAVTGKLWIGGTPYTPPSWGAWPTVTLPAYTVGSGAVVVRVEHAAGVLSNMRTITATP